MGKARRVCAVATILAVGMLPAVGPSAQASFPGTNGRIAFARDVGPSGYDIYAMNPDGSGVTQLTDGAFDLRPAYSPDGEQIVFSRRLPGASRSQIWLMNADGSGQVPLTDPAFDEDDAQFSPDGDRVVFERELGGRPQVFVMNVDGSGVTQLTFAGADDARASDPSFSPDGNQIAFARRTSTTQSEIWIMNSDGSGQRPVTSATANRVDASPSFSPDGARIAFDRALIGPPNDENVYAVNADGSGLAQLTSGPGQDLEPVFSPDGTKIVVDRQDPSYALLSDIVVAGANGLDQDVTPLTANPSDVYDSTPDWQPLNPPSCDLTGSPKQKSVRSVTVTVTCSNEDATVVAQGSGQAPKVKPKDLATASKKTKFTIPTVTAEVQPGTPATITLTIPKKGARALKKAAKVGKKGKATVAATFTDDLGQSTTETFAVKFKKRKKKKS
jgi:dipeptidyl aminopeptidase/acylaminoacyl peptidase